MLLAWESKDQDSSLNIYLLVVGTCVAIWPLWAKASSVKCQDLICLLRSILAWKVYQNNKSLARRKLCQAYIHDNNR